MTISKIRFRTEGAFVVLQVEVRTPERHWPNGEKVEWRDALVEDLLEVGAVIAPRLLLPPSHESTYSPWNQERL